MVEIYKLVLSGVLPGQLTSRIKHEHFNVVSKGAKEYNSPPKIVNEKPHIMN